MRWYCDRRRSFSAAQAASAPIVATSEMMSDPKTPQILVVCTFRNAEQTLRDTLTSLSEQVAEFACVLIDDASTDLSVSLAEATVGRDHRFRIVSNPQPGRVRALNFGLSLGDQSLVAILDADDVAHPCWLEHLLRAAQNEPRFAVIGCAKSLFSDRERLKWCSAIGFSAPGTVRDATAALCRSNTIGHSGVVIRRGAIERVGGYEDKYESHDYDLWVRIAESGGRIGKIELPLVGKRIHDNQHFETRRHIRYVIGSMGVQLRAIKALDPHFTSYLWLLARLAWSIVPRAARMAIRTRSTE